MTRIDAAEDFHVDGEGIRLGQFLKLSSLLDSGGDAKQVIADGDVSVNGVVELRRGCQLRDGDTVSFQDRTVRVRY